MKIFVAHRYMFSDAKNFTGNVSGWDVSRVTNMG